MTKVVSAENMMRIASCSYEGSIFGWNVVEHENEEELVLPMSFGFNCSQGALKSIAVSSSGVYLSCGGTDERIRLFNVAENRSMGELGLHEGAITALEFFEDSHMISGSDDTTLRIWRCHDWECVHVLSGHKEAITSISIHPSGKLALSVSKDNTMKLWNLVQGRCSFTRRLRGAADKVLWHPSGDYYMLTVQMEVQIYRAADNACVASMKHKTRVNKAVFTRCGVNTQAKSSSSAPAQDGENKESESSSDASLLRIVCACEDRTIILYDLEGKQISILDVGGLDGRPRDLWSCELSLPSTVYAEEASKDSSIAGVLAEEGECLVVVTSLGRVCVISCKSLEAGNSLEECTLVSTQVKMEPRLTGVVAWSKASSSASVTKKGSSQPGRSTEPVSNKRPRDSSSAAADIASQKAIEAQAAIAKIAKNAKKPKVAEEPKPSSAKSKSPKGSANKHNNSANTKMKTSKPINAKKGAGRSSSSSSKSKSPKGTKRR